MRRLLAAVGLIAAISDAGAGEFALPTLRGSDIFVPAPPVYTRWAGFYGGVQGGYSSGGMDFGNGVQSLLRQIVRNSILENHILDWTVLPKGDTSNTGWGGFLGYNWQWNDVVVGVEANYHRVTLTQSAADSLSRSFLDNSNAPDGHNYTYNVTASGAASLQLTDIATLRARAGWAAGAVLPYAFVGVAIGRANVVRSANVTGTLTDSYTISQLCGFDGTGTPIFCDTPVSNTSALLLSGPQSEARSGVLAGGLTAGLGMDIELLPHVFVRGEWEYIQFAPIKDIRVSVSTARAGVGFKF